jgi:3-hydroxyisobutyrate dehydrogenase-like beta-hydroxyacid dehydrogenase
MPVRVGFIGCGEVASIFSAAVREHGAEVAGFDVVPEKAAAAGLGFLPLPELAEWSDCVLSTVTTSSAARAAEACVPHLKEGQLYVDLNSTSPSAKQRLSEIVRPSGARFVEGAILGAVGVTRAGTRILLGGPAAGEAAEALGALGLHVSPYSPEIGKASMFKMLRGIFSKGLEALILELLIAGRRAGIEPDLWKDVSEFMARNPFERVAENWLQTHAVAFERRYQEMVQVRETIAEIGLAPVMTRATEAFFARSCQLGLSEAFPSRPASMDEVVAYMERRLGPEPAKAVEGST